MLPVHLGDSIVGAPPKRRQTSRVRHLSNPSSKTPARFQGVSLSTWTGKKLPLHSHSSHQIRLLFKQFYFLPTSFQPQPPNGRLRRYQSDYEWWQTRVKNSVNWEKNCRIYKILGLFWLNLVSFFPALSSIFGQVLATFVLCETGKRMILCAATTVELFFLLNGCASVCCAPCVHWQLW